MVAPVSANGGGAIVLSMLRLAAGIGRGAGAPDLRGVPLVVMAAGGPVRADVGRRGWGWVGGPPSLGAWFLVCGRAGALSWSARAAW
jgi:hypothetical protein